MSISFQNYINITSGVIGGASVATRELITRVFSANPLIPTNSYAEFSSAADVGAYFGLASVEYARAVFYFSFLSKNLTQPNKISFASWVETATVPVLYGDPNTTANLAALQAITAGVMTLTLGVTTHALTALDLSGASSMAAVAAIIQAAVRAASAGGDGWANASVTYNTAFPAGAVFQITGGSALTGMGTVALTPVSGEDVGAAIGWESPAAIVSNGSAAMSLTATMTASNAASTNFASFCYVPALDEAQILELATWNATLNITYMFLAAVIASNAAAVSEAILAIPAVGMTLAPLTAEFPEMLPGMILAATDYNGNKNVSQNYMYQQVAGLTPSVNDDEDQESYDALRVNYYGQTQQAGQAIAFYQRGELTGGITSPTDMNVYANEIWLKTNIGDAFMNALLTLNEIPANTAGQALGVSIILAGIQQALVNGVISVGNTLTQLQIAAINQMAGDTIAWRQVQTIGYWFTVGFTSSVTQDGRTEYQLVYTLIYTKNNAVRKIIGTHALV